MKATATSTPTAPPPFEPVTLTLTLETQEEVNAFFQIGNWSTKVVNNVSTRASCGEAKTTEGALTQACNTLYTALRKFVK